MARVIEKGNLAFNHMTHICDLCIRWEGEFTEYDKRVCKYNTDKKGIYSGLVINQMQNYKCKYYKRGSKYYTIKLQFKNYSITSKGVTKKVKYIRGKFIIEKNGVSNY